MIKSNRMAEAISEGHDRNLWKEVHSLNKSCNFRPNVIDGHIDSEDIADFFSSTFEQLLYNSVGFDEDHMQLLKRTVDSLFINMCVHENDDNDDGHNCHLQHGIYIDDLKKCVNCKKKKMAYFLTILYMVLKNCLKH